MHVDRDLLRNGLRARNVAPVAIHDVMRILEPLFRAAETERIAFAPREELPEKAILDAASRATGRPMTRVVYVSMRALPPKQEWMSEAVHDAMLAASVGDSLEKMLTEMYKPPKDPQNTFLPVIEESVLRGYLFVLGSKFAGKLWHQMRGNVTMTVRCLVALASGPNDYGRLRQLAFTLAHTIPLGTHTDDPQALIVPCA